MRLRYGHQIGGIEEFADRDLMQGRPAARLAERAGAHRLLLVIEAHGGYSANFPIVTPAQAGVQSLPRA
jgi:hypothetical protein